jgi:hypothetical protein
MAAHSGFDDVARFAEVGIYRPQIEHRLLILAAEREQPPADAVVISLQPADWSAPTQ